MKSMSDLSKKKCVPCEGGITPFDISEIHKYQKKVDGWDIIKNGQCVANIREMEWELYQGKLTREITMTICDPKTRDKDLIEIIKFVHTRYPEYKIEVNRENEFTRWLLNRENKNKK